MSRDNREYYDFLNWVIQKYPQYPETKCREDFSQREGLYCVYLATFLLDNN